MKENRIIWCIILSFLTANMVLSESVVSIYLLLGALLIPLGSIFITAVGVQSVDVKIVLPKTCGKRQTVHGRMEAVSAGFLPILRGETEVVIRNILTTEAKNISIVTSFSKEKESIPFTLENAHCGAIEAAIEKITVFDPFGLWKKVIYPEVKTILTVLPDTFVVHLELVRGTMSNNDSIEYAQGKTGNDHSEIFAIREYQEGDSIRNIHWKLSSKCDDIMVKLASLPLENSLLMLLETDLQDEEDLQPAAFDALAEIYMTISQTLVDNEISHKVGWFDHKANRFFIYEINDEDDMHGIMGKFLSVERAVAHSNAVDRYMDEMGHFEQAHLVYVTHRDEGYLEQVPVEIIRTAVICSENGARAGGTYDYTCTPDDYQVQLRSMTI